MGLGATALAGAEEAAEGFRAQRGVTCGRRALPASTSPGCCGSAHAVRQLLPPMSCWAGRHRHHLAAWLRALVGTGWGRPLMGGAVFAEGRIAVLERCSPSISSSRGSRSGAPAEAKALLLQPPATRTRGWTRARDMGRRCSAPNGSVRPARVRTFACANYDLDAVGAAVGITAGLTSITWRSNTGTTYPR